MAAADFAALMAVAREASVAANTAVVREGEPGAALYIIVEGAVAVTKALEQGRVELLNVLTQGDYFGEVALLDAASRSATVVALEPVRLCVIDAAAFHRFVQERPVASASLYRALAVTMSGRLRYLTEKLRDVAERGMTLREDVQRLQTEVMSVVSKELRTPVTVLKGTTDLLAEADLSPHRRERFLQTMAHQAAHLARLLGDINQLVELQYHPAPFARQPAQFQGMLQAVVEELAPAMDRRGIRLTTQIPGTLPPVVVAAEKIHKALLHLVDNGIKFNRERGELTVCARAVDGVPPMVEVAIQDTGPGMHKEVEARVMQGGPAATAVITPGSGGCGVGIALARKLVELHGGTLWCESTAGEGTTVYFTLPT